MTIKQILIGIFCFAIISCNVDKPIDAFFNTIDKTLSETDRKVLDSCQTLECLLPFVQIGRIEGFKLDDSLPQELKAELDSKGIEKYQRLCLFVAYWKDRKHQKYDLTEISNEVNSYISYQKMYWEKLINDRATELLEEFNREHPDLVDTVWAK